MIYCPVSLCDLSVLKSCREWRTSTTVQSTVTAISSRRTALSIVAGFWRSQITVSVNSEQCQSCHRSTPKPTNGHIIQVGVQCSSDKFAVNMVLEVLRFCFNFSFFLFQLYFLLWSSIQVYCYFNKTMKRHPTVDYISLTVRKIGIKLR